MLVSFILYMPKQCLRQSLPVATHSMLVFSRALYFGACISSDSLAIIPWAKACDAEASAAAVPAAKAAGASVVILNAQATQFDDLADVKLEGSISQLLPLLCRTVG